MRSSFPRFPFLLVLAGPVLLFCSACAVFTSYPDQMKGCLGDFEEGRLEPAYDAVKKGFGGGLNQLLYLLEGGMILHSIGSRKESNDLFSQASDRMRRYRERAVLSLTQGTAQLGSLLVNEKTLPYEGEPFEQVLVDTFKATNYLFLGDTEGARVEIRRSFSAQQENRKLHEKELDRMEKEARSSDLSSAQLLPDVEARYCDQESIVSRARNPYEDPFAYYLSAVVYELNREYNDALIDLKRVEDLLPGVPFVQNDLLRMAKLSGLSDAVPRTIRPGRVPRFIDPEQEGELLVIFECGMAPRKRQISIYLPIPRVGIVPLAFPRYEPVPARIQGAALYRSGGKRLARTYVLTDVEAIAFRNLKDRMPILLIKQAIRASAKGAMAKTAQDQGGVLGAVLSNTYNVLTEQADLRSWLTLPKNIQVARLPLPAGRNDLRLAFLDESGRARQEVPVSVDVRPGKISLLNARTGPGKMIDLHLY